MLAKPIGKEVKLSRGKPVLPRLFSYKMKLRFSVYDKRWSKLVRDRDGKCLYCGRTANQYVLNAHHFKDRAEKATRLMLENGITLCVKCHTWSSEFSAHKTPEAFKKWFKKAYPDRVKAVEAKAKTYMSERQAIEEFNALYAQQRSDLLQ